MKYKDLIPPILIKYLKYTKEYDNYEIANAKIDNGAYQNEILCDVVAEKTKIYLEELNARPYKLNATNVFLFSAISNYLNLKEIKTINVVDYGGACGIHYFDVKRFYTNDFKLNWTVVETPQMVRSANKFSLSDGELNFKHSIEQVYGDIDILYSSCALHYVAKPYEELENLVSKRAKWLLFNRMMFNKADRDIYTVQKSLLSNNGPGPLPNGYTEQVIFYPHTTLSYNKFLKYMEENYTLEWLFDETTGAFGINREEIFGKGMLFKLKT